MLTGILISIVLMIGSPIIILIEILQGIRKR